MAVTFLEPGGDATFGIGLWSSSTGSSTQPLASTAQVHGGHLRSIAYNNTSTTNSTVVANSVVSDTGGRMSCYVLFTTYPGATGSILVLSQSGGTTVARIRLTSTGQLQLWEGSVQIGSSGSTLSLNTWYRLCLTWTISSTTSNQFRLYKNGVQDISVSNATLTSVTSANAIVGNGSGDTSMLMFSSDHYVDNNTSLADTGDIWVMAKRPYSNGTANAFTTQVGSGGSSYGTGHAPQVNERANSDTNGWSLSTTTLATEEYNIEPLNVGDMNLTTATIIDYMGWVRAKESTTSNTPVSQIILNGTSSTITLTTAAAVYKQIAGSSTYPAGTGADIGMSGQYTTTAGTYTLYEAGIVVAFNPTSVTFRAAGTPYNSGASASTTSVVIGVPAGTASGDVLIANVVAGGGSGTTITPPTGWKLISRPNQGTNTAVGTYWRAAGGSEPSTYTWTITAQKASGTMVGYSGVDNANPVAGWSSNTNATATTSPANATLIPQVEGPYQKALTLFGGNNATGTSTATAGQTSIVRTDTTNTASTFFESFISETAGTTNTPPLTSVTYGIPTVSQSSSFALTTLVLSPDTSGSSGFYVEAATAVNGGSTGTATTPVISAGYANDIVVVAAAANGSPSTLTLTNSPGLTFTSALSLADATSLSMIQVWTAPVVTATAVAFGTFTVTSNVGTSSVAVTAFVLKGVNTSTPIGATNTAVAANSAPTASLTTTAAGSWVWAVAALSTSSTPITAGNLQAKLYGVNPGTFGKAVWCQNTVTPVSGTSVTNSLTAPASPTGYNVGIFEIIPASGSGTVLTKTQPAIARIANNRSLTQGAIASIATTSTRTQPAVSRIATNRVITQPATARITISLTKIQTATARIAINNLTKQQTAVARIANNGSRTQPAISRISITGTKTQPSIARVARNLTRTQSATARIMNSGLVRTQGAIARIANTKALTQGAVSRIAQNYTKTQSGIARIATKPTVTQPAKARIAQTIAKTQPGISRISQTYIRTQPGIARVARNLTVTQSATARIANSGRVRTQGAMARIATNRAMNQSATGRIAQTYTRTQPGVSRISQTVVLTRPATARVSQRLSYIQTATARIDGITTYSYSVSATARIYPTAVISRTTTIDFTLPGVTSLTLTVPAVTTIIGTAPKVTTLTLAAPSVTSLTLTAPSTTTLTLTAPATTTLTATVPGATSLLT